MSDDVQCTVRTLEDSTVFVLTREKWELMQQEASPLAFLFQGISLRYLSYRLNMWAIAYGKPNVCPCSLNVTTSIRDFQQALQDKKHATNLNIRYFVVLCNFVRGEVTTFTLSFIQLKTTQSVIKTRDCIIFDIHSWLLNIFFSVQRRLIYFNSPTN